ncbi:MAG: PHP domain-containing protein [Candidatus Daviesbacteria bacterium]|nr:PHP domain-containing protein [Candidatus Daviesbacteria bacterium]
MEAFLGKYSPDLLLADHHIHTRGSDGCLKPAEVIEFALKHNLKTIGITDHEVIAPALKVKKYCEDKGITLEVIIASEITTRSGHLVGLYLTKDIPSGKSLEWTIQAIHDQNGLVIAPHPFYWITRSLGKEKVISIAKNPHEQIYFDGFEVQNGAIPPFLNCNTEAQKFFLEHWEHLGAPLGCSDAHRRCDFGGGFTGYHKDLRQAIKSKQTTVIYQQNLDKELSLTSIIEKTVDTGSMLGRGLIFEPARRFQRYLNYFGA